MPIILIDNIEPGMVLADDVADRQGRTLLKAGVELTEKHIKVFKTWGVAQINIVGDANEPAFAELIEAHPELVREAEQHAAHIFQHVDQHHPLFQKIIAKSKEYYVRRKAAEL